MSKMTTILINKDGHIRCSDAVAEKGDCEVEVSEAFLDEYYVCYDRWAIMRNKLERMCEEEGKEIE